MDIRSVSPQMIPLVSAGIESATKAAQESSSSTGLGAIRDAFQKMADREGVFLTSGKGLSGLAHAESPGLYLSRLCNSRGLPEGLARQWERVSAKLRDPHFQMKHGLESLLEKQDQIRAKLQNRFEQDTKQVTSTGLSASLSQTPAISTQVDLKDPTSLGSVIKDVEANMESVRNQRQMARTTFQGFDQKMNQMYNMLSSVMKTMNEMRTGTARNLL